LGVSKLMALRLFPSIRRWLVAIAAVIAVAASASASALNEKRVALVIGNSAYQSVAALPNPTNDAEAVGELFKKAAFDLVTIRLNLGNVEIRRAVREFAAAAQNADIVVVYYAGHGMELGGTNYLIPVDAELVTDFDVVDESFSLDRLLEVIPPGRQLRLVILDACRENPFIKKMKRTTASRSIGRGLASIELTTVNTLVAYAAAAGSVAADGNSLHSPYTTALLKNIAQPGLDVRIALGRVRDEVFRLTHGKQTPFLYGSLGGSNISLTPNAAIAVAPPLTRIDDANIVQQAKRSESEDLRIALQTEKVEALEAYLQKYPESAKRSEVLSTISRLKRSEFDEWTLYEVGNKRFPHYIKISSIEQIGDRVAVRTHGSLDPSDSDQKKFADAAYYDDLIVFDCKQPIWAKAEATVVSKSGPKLEATTS
jgi:hypothetical protein